MAKIEISKVHDAYRQPGECPLCVLVDAAEKTYLASFLRGRVMEPSARLLTNQEGFCADHWSKLYAGENRLGLGLVAHTRLQHVRDVLQRGVAEASKSAERRRGAKAAAGAPAEIAALTRTCAICGLLRSDVRRWAFTILYLWARDPQFPPVFRASRGFCIPHFVDVLDEAGRSMRADRLRAWLADAGALMRDSLEALEKDLLDFTQLHQAQNSALGSDEVRSALRRTLQKLGAGAI